MFNDHTGGPPVVVFAWKVFGGQCHLSAGCGGVAGVVSLSKLPLPVSNQLAATRVQKCYVYQRCKRKIGNI